MTLSESVEGVIEVASRLKESVADLYDAYGLFPTIIDNEHRAIRASDYDGVEQARIQKEAAADKIEAAFYALQAAGERLGKLRAALTNTAVARPVTLTECL